MSNLHLIILYLCDPKLSEEQKDQVARPGLSQRQLPQRHAHQRRVDASQREQKKIWLQPHILCSHACSRLHDCGESSMSTHWYCPVVFVHRLFAVAYCALLGVLSKQRSGNRNQQTPPLYLCLPSTAVGRGKSWRKCRSDSTTSA